MAATKKSNTSPKKYVVTAPVKDFSGVGAAGVHFAYGKAIVHEGWVLNWYKERGYKVEELKEQAPELIEPNADTKAE